MKRMIFFSIIFTLLLAACAPAASDTTTTSPTEAGSSTVVTDGAFDLDDWESVLAASEGQTVNWYIWGGSDKHQCLCR